jgi:hypothetical protein
VPGRDEGVELFLKGAVRRPRELQMHKHPVRAVNRRGAEGFAVHGDDPGFLFAGAFGDQLLHPQAETGDLFGGHDGHLVAAGFHGGAEPGAEGQPRVRFAFLPAGVGLPGGAVQEFFHADADQGGGHEAEVGEGGETTPHVGAAEEGFSEGFFPRQLFEGRPRVGDRDELGPGRLDAGFFKPSPKMFEQRHDFDGAA